MPFQHNITEEQIGMRIDHVLAALHPDRTRSALQKLLEQKQVLVNKKAVAKNYKMRVNDQIELTFSDPVALDIQPENIPLDVLYEDEDLLVVNKPKGMVVHPAAGNDTGTLVHALLYHCRDSLSGINGVMRPGIVHRIDKDTSGVLMVAKNDFAHQHLAAQIKEHSFLREYRAMVYGNVKTDEGIVDAPIGRSQKDRKRMCVTDRNAKQAVTHYEVLTRYEGFTYMKFRLETGRTHQIRVHMAYEGFPIAGDAVYGPKKVIAKLQGQCLHAMTLGFEHPKTGEWMEFSAPLPSYFESFQNTLRQK